MLDENNKEIITCSEEEKQYEEAIYNDRIITEKINKNSKLKIREPLRGFEVLVGGTWIEPKAALSGEKINLKSEGEIESVRYLWKNWALPDVCIFNSEDMPLAPFLKNKN